MARMRRSGAVALRYQTEEPFRDVVPRLVAKGQGLLADRMLELARQHGVPVQQDPDLLMALEPLDLDSLIPPELFQAVAIVLASLYRVNRQAGADSGRNA